MNQARRNQNIVPALLVIAPLLIGGAATGCKKKDAAPAGGKAPAAGAPSGAAETPKSAVQTPTLRPAIVAEAASVFGTKSRLLTPRSVAADAAGNVYVADTGNARIVKFDPQGREVAHFGRKGTGSGEFQQPWSVAVSAANQILVLDQGTGWILAFTTDGKYVNRLGGPAASFYSPLGLGLAKNGTFAVADTGGNRIVLFDAQGAVQDSVRKIGTNDLLQPTDVVFSNDSLLVVEPVPGPKAILFRASRAGELQGAWSTVNAPSTTDSPRVAVASDGRIFLTSPDERRVVILSADGSSLTPLEFEGLLEAPPRRLAGIALDGFGNAFVTDAEANVVYRLKLPGGAPAPAPKG